MIRPVYFFAATLLALAGCSKRSGPLPGDSVGEDGSVALAPPKPTFGPESARPAPREPLGPIEAALFAPELVMDHQAELAIGPQQRDRIVTEIERGQAEMVRLQWELQGEKEKLVKVLSADKIDEKDSAAAGLRVMDRESKVKASHLAMLVRLKNLLSPEQQKKLKKLRGDAPTDTPADAGSSDAAR